MRNFSLILLLIGLGFTCDLDGQTVSISNPLSGAAYDPGVMVSVTYEITGGTANRCWQVQATCDGCTSGNASCEMTLGAGGTGTCAINWTLQNVSNTVVNFVPNAQRRATCPSGNLAGGQLITGATVSVNVALPVQLTAFRAKKVEDFVALEWQTATELNNEAFLIEKSLDGKNFLNIGKVNGAGTSFTTHNYFFVDETVQKGIAYYRLKQVDFDGTSEYSDVVSVFMDPSNPEVKVYPNPSKDFAYLSLGEIKENLQSIQVINAYGSLAKTFYYNGAILEDDIQLDLSGLQSGSYYLQMIFKNKTTTERISKL